MPKTCILYKHVFMSKYTYLAILLLYVHYAYNTNIFSVHSEVGTNTYVRSNISKYIFQCFVLIYYNLCLEADNANFISEFFFRVTFRELFSSKIS